MELNREQNQILKYSFLKIALKADIVADLFYFRFLELKPELKLQFQFKNRTENNRVFIYMIKSIITTIDEPLQLHYILKDKLNNEQEALILTNLEISGHALIWALQRSLTSNFTEEVKDSWLAAVALLKDIISENSKLLNPVN
jgi:hemoglobin-like flavoprotein